MSITLPDALRILESGEWVSLRYLTANLQKRSGGQVIELAKCRIARRQTSDVTTVTGDKPVANSRNPNHRQHFTRNVELLNRQIRKVHPILITHINQQSVL